LFLCAFSLTVRAQDARAQTHQDHFLARRRGRFDHFAIDAKGHRLFVAALGNNTVEVLDSRRAKGSRASPNCTNDWRDLLFGRDESALPMETMARSRPSTARPTVW